MLYPLINERFPEVKDAVVLLPEKPLQQKKRMLVKKGGEYVLLRLKDIVLFRIDQKSVYAIDREEKIYKCEYNLGDVEMRLDPFCFFRANRQYIVNIDYIKGYGSFEKVKIVVRLTAPFSHLIIISQQRAPKFREWIGNA